MNKSMKIIGFILSFIAFIILAYVFILKFVPGKDLVESMPESFLQTSDVICSYPVRVSGNSMEPEFQNGEVVIFNKCILDPKDLPTGSVVVFQGRGNAHTQRVGRIQSYSSLGGEFEYKISFDSRSNDPIPVSPEEIIAFLELND